LPLNCCLMVPFIYNEKKSLSFFKKNVITKNILIV
jgi:hypothetical protein